MGFSDEGDVLDRLDDFSRLQQHRLAFIDFNLFWYGQISRSAILDEFLVSEGTAKKDIRIYRELGGHLALRNGMWRATPDFAPIIVVPDAEDFLYTLGRAQGVAAPYAYASSDPFGSDTTHERRRPRDLLPFDGPPELGRREIDPFCLRRVIQAIREGRMIRIVYGSPHGEAPQDMWIAPHALNNDAFRWATRAWRSDHGRYGDVVLDRIQAVKDDAPSKHPGCEDHDWSETFCVRLGANAGLDTRQRSHIERQYDMRDGELRIRMRKAMLLAFLKRYQIEEAKTDKAPHQAPLVVLNREEVTAALPPWKRIPPEPA